MRPRHARTPQGRGPLPLPCTDGGRVPYSAALAGGSVGTDGNYAELPPRRRDYVCQDPRSSLFGGGGGGGVRCHGAWSRSRHRVRRRARARAMLSLTGGPSPGGPCTGDCGRRRARPRSLGPQACLVVSMAVSSRARACSGRGRRRNLVFLVPRGPARRCSCRRSGGRPRGGTVVKTLRVRVHSLGASRPLRARRGTWRRAPDAATAAGSPTGRSRVGRRPEPAVRAAGPRRPETGSADAGNRRSWPVGGAGPPLGVRSGESRSICGASPAGRVQLNPSWILVAGH